MFERKCRWQILEKNMYLSPTTTKKLGHDKEGLGCPIENLGNSAYSLNSFDR